MKKIIKIKVSDVYFDISKEGFDNDKTTCISVYNKYTGKKLGDIKQEDVNMFLDSFIELILIDNNFIEIPY